MTGRRSNQFHALKGFGLVMLMIFQIGRHDAWSDTRTTPSTDWPAATSQNRPWTRWWWLGSAVDKKNLGRELTRYHQAGLGGVEITPIYGVNGWEDREIPFLSERWMEMLGHAVTTSQSLGMQADMTTGTGWCFGGPTVSPSDANAVLVTTREVVPAGGTPVGTFPRESIQTLMAFSTNGTSLDLTGKINAKGFVDWKADGGPWEIYAISQKPSGVVVKRSAPGGAGPMLNPIYPDAMRRYLQWFDKPFTGSKPELRALFQDSYEYKSDWAPDFLERFEKLRGYPLQNELPSFLGNGNDDHTARVKSDYRETVSDIMTLETMPVWVDWSHAHGYLARYQAHGAPANLLDLYADADIPETEMFHLDRNILISKFASSAAHVAGRNLASAETGTWVSEHFTESLEDMKHLVDDMFLSGINHIIYHGTTYSPDGIPWPGWCFYASAEINPRNPIWHDFPTLNSYVTKCQSILQSGDSDNGILLYWPVYDLWNDPEGMLRNCDIAGKWFENQPIGTTAHMLWNRGYSFDYISDRQLAGIADKKNGSGAPLHGKQRVIVVPPCGRMPLDTLRQLLKLANNGATVVFDEKLPADVPGLADLETRRNEFRSLLAGIPFHDQDGWKEACIGKGQVVVGNTVTALERAGAPRESMCDHSGIHYVKRTTDTGNLYFIVNTGPKEVDERIVLGCRASLAELMDPMSGKTGFTPALQTAGENTEIRLQLAAGESVIVRTFSNDSIHQLTPTPAWLYAPHATPIILNGTWSVKFTGGGPELPQSYTTYSLRSWTECGDTNAVRFAGTALYSLLFDAPAGVSGPCVIDLGQVSQSASITLNGRQLGTVISSPFRVAAPGLLPKGNRLEVEVTSTAANRVRDLDIRNVPWKTFHNPNLLSLNYKPFDSSWWKVSDAGLLGPVTVTPYGHETGNK